MKIKRPPRMTALISVQISVPSHPFADALIDVKNAHRRTNARKDSKAVSGRPTALPSCPGTAFLGGIMRVSNRQ